MGGWDCLAYKSNWLADRTIGRAFGTVCRLFTATGRGWWRTWSDSLPTDRRLRAPSVTTREHPHRSLL